MKILVTGGAGYIGSVVVADLIGAGREVVVYDNLSSGHVHAVPKGTMLVRGDLSNRGLLKSALAEHHPIGVTHD
ncbi:MAG: NAD-dependent epimerase/dehydratase family protein [Terriglobales bacterium]